MNEKHGLVIFDIDGTLFRGADATIAAVEAAFAEFGFPQPDPAEIPELVGKPTSDLHAWLSRHCPPGRADQLAAEVDRLELSFVADGASLYPGVLEALGKIRAFAAQMAICTNGPKGYVERVVADHKLGEFFHVIRYRQTAADTKVSMVRELLKQLQARPAVVVGDRRDDVEAAHQNGLAAVAVLYGYGSPAELAEADYVAVVASDLPSVTRLVLSQRLEGNDGTPSVRRNSQV